MISAKENRISLPDVAEHVVPHLVAHHEQQFGSSSLAMIVSHSTMRLVPPKPVT